MMWQDLTLDQQIDFAMERSSKLPDRPIALSAEYNRDFDMLILHIDNGDRLLIPREQLEGLENATPEQLARVQIFAGVDIAWDEIDVNHYLPYLMEGKYASERWKQARKQQQVAA